MKNNWLTLLTTLIIGAQSAHVHGTWDLFAAVDGARLEISISGPMDDALGFEHKPETAAEEKAVADLITRLHSGKPLVDINAEAGCVATRPATVTLPFDHDGHDEHDDHDDHNEEHHDDHGDHDEHDDHDGHHAGNIEVAYAFRCANPKALASLTFTGFDLFPAIQKVDAVVLTAAGQKAKALTKAAPVLSAR